MSTMRLNTVSKWFAIAVVALLGATGVRAIQLPISTDFVGGQNLTNDQIVIWGSGIIYDPLTNWVQDTSDTNFGPHAGIAATVGMVDPSGDPNVPAVANNYPPDYDIGVGITNAGISTPPLFGTYFTYFPTNMYWYGIDFLQVKTKEYVGAFAIDYSVPATLVVTNIMDPPVASADTLFVGDVDYCASLNKTGAVGIVAFDYDNLTNAPDYGLIYTFTDGSYTQSTLLGIATLTNNQLYIAVTNPPPITELTNFPITVRVRDIADRDDIVSPNFNVYTNDSGINNVNDYTDLVVNVYYIYRNNLFVGGEGQTQDVLAYGFDDLTNFPPTLLDTWTITTPPLNGTCSTNVIQAPDSPSTNNWPYYGTQTWWGTHFTYVPTDLNWWGFDSMTVSNANGSEYFISIAVTNIMDTPVVAPYCDIFINPTNCSGFSVGTLAIQATDVDNVYTNADFGLVYTFTNDATVWSNELGEATLVGSNLTFVVTNLAAQVNPAPVILPIRVRDMASRTNDNGCTNYVDSSGANNVDDYVDINVNVYNSYSNPFFVDGEGATQDILAWSNAPSCAFDPAMLLDSWAIIAGPANGSIGATTTVSPDPINATNNWPYYGASLPWWGTHFQYTPNANWYGVDTITVQTNGYTYDIPICVTNIYDAPTVSACDIMLLTNCASTFATGTTVIVATDLDNLSPVDPSFGLVFTFTNGLTVWNNELGDATLVGSNLTFVITNLAPQMTPVPYVLPVRVHDYALRPDLVYGCTNYVDASGTNNTTADYTDINILVYNNYSNPNFVSGEEMTQDILAWSNATTCTFDLNTDQLYSWMVVSGPANGMITGTNTIYPINPYVNWPYFGAQPWWGTHFTYVPNTNWYGVDTITVGTTPELVFNGTFDADLSGWTPVNNDGFTTWTAGTGNPPGSFQNGNVAGIAHLYQYLATVSGQTYTVSFDIQNTSLSGDNLEVLFGDLPLLGATPLTVGFQNYSYTVVATSATTRINIRGDDAPSYWYIDNVSVVGIPNSANQYDIPICVTNIMDVPLVTAPGLFLLNCNAGAGCGSTNGSVDITASDPDNVYYAPDYGLGITFTNGATTWTNELGDATLTGSNLAFVVTNVAAPSVTYYLPILVQDTGARAAVSYGCTNYPDVTGAADPNDYTIINVPVIFSIKNDPIIVTNSPVRFHDTNDTPYVIYEGEAVNFGATAYDYATNNGTGSYMTECMFGITAVVWTVTDVDSATLLYSETTMPTNYPTANADRFDWDPGNGTNFDASMLASTFVFDTSSDRWFNYNYTPTYLPYTARVQVEAYDVCGNVSMTNWDITVWPTLETPVITFDPVPDVVLGDTGILHATEHNSNDVFFVIVPGGTGNIDFDPSVSNNVAFTGTVSGSVTVKAYVMRDNQVFAGAVSRTFQVLIGTNLFKRSVVVITGNDTNDTCYGEINITGPASNPTGPWADGTPLTISAVETALGVANGGYTFIRWGYESPWELWRQQASTVQYLLGSGYDTNDLGSVILRAIFKKTSELAVPVVNPFDYVTNSLPCAKIGKDFGSYIITNALGEALTVNVQSEDLPGLEAVGLPPGMQFSASIAVSNYPLDFAWYDFDAGGIAKNNNTFSNLTISGTPTTAGTYTVILYATNAYWNATNRDENAGDVMDPGNIYTNRDVLASFVIEVKTQELADVVAPSPVTITPATGKLTKPYASVILPSLTIDSDSLVGLQITNLFEQTGLTFTYVLGSVTTGGQANCYIDQYNFTNLVISGTPTSYGTFPLTLEAVNQTGTNNVSTFNLTILDLNPPVVERAPVFLAPDGRVDRAYDYSLGSCGDTVCRELLVWSECELQITTSNLPPGLSLKITTEDTYDASFNPNNWSNAYYYTCLRIIGTPTNAGTYAVSILAENCTGTTVIVSDEIVIKPHEVIAPVWTNTVVPSAKSNWVYSYEFSSLLQPVTVKADLATTLRIDGLPAGLSFSFGGLQTAIGNAASDNLDTWQFSNLKISGTPTVSGTFPCTLVAYSSATQAIITVFTLTVDAQQLPIFKNPAIFAETVPNARILWAYDFTFANALVVYSDNTKPTITVTGLPAGLSATLVGTDSSAADGSYGTAYTYGRLEIAGTPTANVGTNLITVTASNAIGTASLTFNLVVLPQTTVVDAKTFTTVLTDAKSNWVYSCNMPDVEALKSDSAVTLVLSNALPTGLQFTYAVHKTSDGSAANGYRETYTFSALNIAGTPMQVGVFTNTLVARNAAGDVVLSANFTLTVAAQGVPVFKNPAIFSETVTKARKQWAYDFSFANALVVYSDSTKPTITVTGLPAGLSATLVGTDSSAADGTYGTAYTYGKLQIAGTPTVAGTNTITVTASNAVGTASLTFSLVVMPQTTVVDATTFATSMPNAKSNWLYSFDFPSAIQPLVMKSDSAATLDVTGLPAGLAFSYSSRLTATGSAANDYRDTYEFTNLKIAGTPTQVGVFTPSVRALNAAGIVVLSTNFTLTVTAQQAPIFKNPAIFSETVTKARRQWAYDFSFANALVVYSDSTKPTITVTGLPAGLSATLVGTDSSAADGTYGTAYTYGKLQIAGTPTVAGTNTITVTASNAVGTASLTFSLVVMPQTTVVDATTFATVMPDAKSNWLYSFDFPSAIQPLVMKSDSAATLDVTGLPAGLAFSYSSRLTATGSAANDYRDTYEFTNLKIAGTPTQVGVFTPSVRALNAAGIVVLSTNFTLTVAVQQAPIFKNPAIFSETVTKARRQWAYDFSFANALVVYSDSTKPTITVTGLPAGLSATLVGTDSSAADGTYGTAYTYGKLQIAGTPTVAGTNTITVTASNAVGTASLTFSLVVMPQTTVVDATTFVTVIPNAKSNCPYAFDFPSAVQPLVMKSDSAVTLDVTGLPTGLALSYGSRLTETGSAANDYRDTYEFTNLKIAGTPTQAGVFTLSLRAVNAAGVVVLSGSFTLTVTPQTIPVFKNPAIFNETVQTARAQRSYDFTFAGSMIVYSDNTKPVITVTGLPAGLSYKWVGSDSSAASNDYGTDYTYGRLNIYGTPTTATTATVSVVANNAIGSASVTFTLVVLPRDVAMTPVFATRAPDAKVTKAYSFDFPSAVQPVIVQSDSAATLQIAGLPAGLTFTCGSRKSSNGGVGDWYRDTYEFYNLNISGTPTVAGTNTCILKAVNAAGDAVISTFTLVVTPLTVPQFVNTPWFDQPLAIGRVGRAYDYTFSGDLVISSDNTVPVLKVTGLPPGLQFNFNGYTIAEILYGNTYTFSGLRIGGTPETNGTFTVTFTASNSVGVTTRTFELIIKPHSNPILVPPVTVPTPPNGKITKPYSYTFPGHPIVVKSDIPVTLDIDGLAALGLTLSYDWTITVGSAFTDNLDTYTFTNLKIAGTPTIAGTFLLTLKAKNGVTPDATIYTFTLIIDPATVNPVPSSLSTSGTFDGWSASGSFKGVATMSVVASAGVPKSFSGKFMIADQGYTFQGGENSVTQTVDGIYLLNTFIMIGVERIPLTLQVADDHVFAVDAQLDRPVAIDLFRNRWAEAPVPANMQGYYTMALPCMDGVAGSAYLTLTVSGSGSIKLAGKLGDGTPVSFSSTLIAAGGNRQAPYLMVINPASPVNYNGGFIFGVAEIVSDAAPINRCIRLFTSELNTNDTISVPAECVIWVNNNPMATANYNDATDYGTFTDYLDSSNHGFVRALDVSGGWYSQTSLVGKYFVGDIGDVEDLTYSGNSKYAQDGDWGTGGLQISTNKKGVYLAPKADSLKRVGNGFDYENDSNHDGNVNTAGLKYKLNKATGIYGGSFKLFFTTVTGVNQSTGAQSIRRMSTTVKYEGVMMPVREFVEDGVGGRGYFLLPDSSSYVNASQKAVTYKFNWSYDFYLND